MRTDLLPVFVSKWRALAAALGVDAAKARDIEAYLCAQYTGSSRHYHNVHHILSMLEGFDAVKAKFAQPLAAKLAIFFHDVIYEAARRDNEVQSAQKLREMLGGVVAHDIMEAAIFSIEATQHHAATTNADTNLLLDLDMAILGQPWAVYARYAHGVMQEYLPIYGEDAYRQGRCTLFLEPTIAQGHIFITQEFSHLQEPALRNLRREMDILKSGKFFEGTASRLD